jgi:hypothetical protein
VALVRQEILRYRWKKSTKALGSKMRQKYLGINQSWSNRSRVQIISYFNNNEKFLPGGVEDRGDLIEASGEDILAEADGWRTPWGSVEAEG